MQRSGSEDAPSGALIYRFSGHSLDTSRMELRRGDAVVAIERKPLDVLICLLERPGEVVTKEELQDTVWPGRYLSESVLTKAMARLRAALGEDAAELIRTVHGYGYRLMAPVDIQRPRGRRRLGTLALEAGQSPPGRPDWALLRHLGQGGFGEVWLGQHRDTQELRVFKFAPDAHGLRALRREVTLFRLLQETYGERTDVLPILGWNFKESPCFIESPYLPSGSLTEWAQAQGGLGQVPLATRIRLVAQAADALSAAHGAGILHKDIKPSNLLIAGGDADSVHIVLGDFGSGRILDPEKLEQLRISRLGLSQTQAQGSTSGTPFYYAPELLAGLSPTAQTDIYALGVVLYQCVVGDLQRPMAAGWERDVDDPLLREDIAAAAASQPSARLTDAAELARRLHTLPARRAAKDAAATAEARANALQAALEQSRRRRRWTSMVALLLGLGLLGTGLMYGQVRSARDEALEAQAQAAANQAVAEAINRFLVEDLLAQANPLRSGQDDVPIRELLGRAASEAEARFAAYPAQEAAVRVAIGQALAGIGQLEEAASELERALSLPALPSHLADQARLSLGDIHATKDLGEKARPLLTQTIQARDPRVRLKAEALLARLDYLEWKFDLALERIDRVLPETRAVFGPRSAEVAWLMSHRGQVLAEQGVFPQALEDAQLAADITRELYGPEDLRRIDGLEALGTAFTLAGRLDEAESIFTERHRLTLNALGPRHDLSLRAATDLAYVLRETDRLQQALELLTPVLRTRQEDFGPEHVLTRNVWTLYAQVLNDLGRREEAITEAEALYAVEYRVLGPEGIDTLIDGANLAGYYTEAGRAAEAVPLIRQVVAGLEKSQVPHTLLAAGRHKLAQALWGNAQGQEALAVVDTAIAALAPEVEADNERLQDLKALQAQWRLALSGTE